MKKVLIFISVLFLVIANVYSQTESFLIYKQKIESVNGRIIHPLSPVLSFYVNLENNMIVSYAIGTDSYYSVNRDFSVDSFRIEITHENIVNFKEALNRFLEWEARASINNLTERFSREIPISVSSNNVLWSRYVTLTTESTFRNNSTPFLIQFNFRWTPSNIEFARGQLDITSNTVSASGANSFRLVKSGIGRDEARLLSDNLTDSKIQEAIQRGRAEEQERNRQRQLQDELFR
jgi:hypothetical protein